MIVSELPLRDSDREYYSMPFGVDNFESLTTLANVTVIGCGCASGDFKLELY